MSKSLHTKQFATLDNRSTTKTNKKNLNIMTQKEIKPILTPRGRSRTPPPVENLLGDSSIFKEGSSKKYGKN